MTPVFQTLRAILAALLAGAAPAVGLAQGMSGAVISGLVTDQAGDGLSALVRLESARTGFTREVRSGQDGRFRFDNLEPAIPYRVEARYPGFVPASADVAPPAIGSVISVRLTMDRRASTSLPAVVVRTGDGTNGTMISSSTVRALPLLDRDFTALFVTSPAAVGRTTLSIGGQHPGLNGVQLDGFVANDVYGVSRMPGAAAGAAPISVESVEQVRTFIAPFDVRLGAFTGGLISAVTRAGTNTWQTEFFTSAQAPWLVGPDTSGATADRFSFLQYGLALGGPLVRDRAHLFVVADLQRSRTPFIGPVAGDPGTGVSIETAERAAAAFRSQYGIDAGGPEAPVLSNPGASVLARVDWHLAPSHVLTAWQNSVRARRDNFNRLDRTGNSTAGWQLSRSGNSVRAAVNAERLRLTSALGRFANELLLGTQVTRETRSSNLRSPLFLIEADVPGTYLAGGSVRSFQDTRLDQRFTELTDNLTWNVGAHAVVLGTHLEWFEVTDRLFQGAWGTWTFPGIDAFEAGQPARYEISLPLRDGGPVGRFHVRSIAGYAQDQWAVDDRLLLTVGARVDVSSATSPSRNPVLAADTALGFLDTSVIPGGRAIISPRFDVTWLVRADGAVRVHAGLGDFRGRSPYVWMGNAFISTGSDATTLKCNLADGVPAPVLDVTRLPAACTIVSPSTTQRARAAVLSRDFEYPNVRKLAAGIEARLGESLTGSLEWTRTVNRSEPYLVDLNLVSRGTSAEGRPMYGTLASNGAGRPTRRDSSAFDQVLEYRSRANGRSSSLLLSLRWQAASGRSLEAGYQWSSARDANSLLSPNAFTAMGNAPLDGAIDSQRLGTSLFDARHSLVVIGMAGLPGRVRGAVLLRAQSGQPFTWIVNGDANADGVNNDALYVPRTDADITLANPEFWPALDHFIESQPCLRTQRGRIMRRNSCRNPAFLTADARVSREIAVGARHATLDMDVFNFPNLLNHSWGLVRETTSRPQQTQTLLAVKGRDLVRNRPVYEVPTIDGQPVLPALVPAVLDASRWRAQVTLRLRP